MCPGWDSNPHWTVFETAASAVGLPGRAGEDTGGPPRRHQAVCVSVSPVDDERACEHVPDRLTKRLREDEHQADDHDHELGQADEHAEAHDRRDQRERTGQRPALDRVFPLDVGRRCLLRRPSSRTRASSACRRTSSCTRRPRRSRRRRRAARAGTARPRLASVPNPPNPALSSPLSTIAAKIDPNTTADDDARRGTARAPASLPTPRAAVPVRPAHRRLAERRSVEAAAVVAAAVAESYSWIRSVGDGDDRASVDRSANHGEARCVTHR